MAAGTIKGITIEIEGKTSGLVKSLGDVNKSLQQTQKSLKTVNDALKLDPKNIDTLKTKQNLLNQAINETKEKLKLEQKAAEDAAKALEAGTITQNQYNTLQAEVAKTSSELKNLEGQAQRTDAQIKDLGSGNKLSGFKTNLSDVGEKLQSIGSKITEIGGNLTKYVSVPLAGLGAAMIKSFTSVDDALDTIALKTGAAGEELESMRETARNMAKEMPTEFNTAAAAVGEVNTRFGYTGEQLDELSRKYTKFADINKVDVSDAVDQTQKALAAFGKDGKSAAHLLDILNKTAQQTGAKTNTLTSGLVSNAAAFQELGLTMEQSVAIMGRLEKSGADSSTVMSALRKALKNATKDGVPLKDALRDLQSAIKDGTGEVDGLTYAYDLFGKSGDAVYAAIKNGTVDFTNMTSAAKDLSTAAGSVDDTYKNLEDGSGTLKVAQNNLKDSLSEVGGELLEALTPVIKDFCELLKGFCEWWNSLDDGTKKVIATIGLVVIAIGPLTSAIGGIISIGGTLVKGIGGVINLIGGAGGLSSVLTATCAGPLAAVVLSIVAIIEVIKHWDEILEVLEFAWEKVCEGIEDLMHGLANVWNDVVDGIVDGIEAITGSIAEANAEASRQQAIADAAYNSQATIRRNAEVYGSSYGITGQKSYAGSNSQAAIQYERQQNAKTKAAQSSSTNHNVNIYMGSGNVGKVVYDSSKTSAKRGGGN